jgi:predicted transposase/invertase (TIGR01784 family)
MSREEIEAMFGLSELKNTRVYQEALEEGERRIASKAVPLMLRAGLSIEQIAQGLGLSIEEVRQIAEQQPPNFPIDS